MSITELRAEREKLGLDAGGPSGQSIAERAQEDPVEIDQEELFILDQGRRVTIGKLIAAGVPVEYRVSLNAKSVKGGRDMGLLSFKDPNIVLVVSAREGKVAIEPTYTEEGEVEKVTVIVNFRPQSVHDAQSPEGLALLGLE